jgi:hypothetical protein
MCWQLTNFTLSFVYILAQEHTFEKADRRITEGRQMLLRTDTLCHYSDQVCVNVAMVIVQVSVNKDAVGLDLEVIEHAGQLALEERGGDLDNVTSALADVRLHGNTTQADLATADKTSSSEESSDSSDESDDVSHSESETQPQLASIEPLIQTISDSTTDA